MRPSLRSLDHAAFERRHLALVFSAGTSLLACAALVGAGNEGRPFGLIFLLWAAGLAAAPLAWVTAADARSALARLAADRQLVRDLVLVFLLALVMRALWLDRLPPNLTGDEFSQALEGRRFADGELANMFGVSMWYSVPHLYMWLGSFFFRVFGPDPWPWRLFTALAGALTVPLLYLLVRVQFGRPRTAVVAAVLLAVHHVHLYFTRLGSNQGFDALFITAMLLAIVLGRRDAERGLWWISAGIVAGLGFYFYFALRGVAAMGLAIIVLLALRREIPRLRAAAWYVAGMALAVLPHLGALAFEESTLNARVRQVWVGNNLQGMSAYNAVVFRSRAAVQTVQGLGLKGWYESGAGLLVSRLELVLLVVGLVIALRRVRSAGWIHPLVLTGVWASVALLFENPVAGQRITGATAPAMVMVALGLDHLVRLAGGRRQWITAVVLVALVAAINVSHLFFSFLPGRTIDTTALVATEVGRRLMAEPDLKAAYFCGTGQMDWSSNSALPFRLPWVAATNVPADWPVPTDPVAPGTVYVSLPGCPDLTDRLLAVPGLEAEVLAFRKIETRQAPRMYLDTGGRGYVRWAPHDEWPGAEGEGEQAVLVLFRPAASP